MLVHCCKKSKTNLIKSLKYLNNLQRNYCAEKNVIKSKCSDLIIPKQLIQEYVWTNLNKYPNKTAVICFDTGKQYTYLELYKKCHAVSINLTKNLALKKGDCIAIIMPNLIDFPVAFLGAIQAGFIVTTINPFYTPDEIAWQLKDSNSQLVFTTTQLYPCVVKAIQKISLDIPIIITNLSNKENIPLNCMKLEDFCTESNFTENPSPASRPEDVVLLPYSSGTTGLTKAVQLTHLNVVSNLYQMSCEDFSIHNETTHNFQDVVPIFLPIFHIYGMVGIFLNFLSKGCQLVMISNFVASQFTKLITNYQPTLLFAVPQIIVSILNNHKLKYEDISSIRTITSAAAPLGNLAAEKFQEKTKGKIPLLQIYGMTETSPLTLMQSTKLANGRKIGGSGFVLPNTQCKIISLETGESLPENQTGELLVKGPQVMKGYLNNAQANSEVLLKNGWLRTGDIGHYDDSQHFFITDRLKELIKVKGFQVAPAELEELIKTHSSVKDVAVIGVPHPVQGEAPRAFVVLEKNAKLKSGELKNFVASKVANYKRLVGGVVFMEEIPRNSAGKILRRELKRF